MGVSTQRAFVPLSQVQPHPPQRRIFGKPAKKSAASLKLSVNVLLAPTRRLTYGSSARGGRNWRHCSHKPGSTGRSAGWGAAGGCFDKTRRLRSTSSRRRPPAPSSTGAAQQRGGSQGAAAEVAASHAGKLTLISFTRCLRLAWLLLSW